jgi:NitT/TauT family transport system ATP-binding protein
MTDTGGVTKTDADTRVPVLVTLDRVGFAYRDGTRAVDSVSLEVGTGRVISVVGPSGCGKSTLLGLIAGLSTPTEGAVRWGDPGSDGRTAGLFTMMFQKDTLLPWLSVRANVDFGLRYQRLRREERDARLDRLLRMGGLTEFADAYPNQLSGGMRRRAAFLTSVAPFPRMLLLDEPFSALDEPTRVALHADVRAIVRELGMTVLLVTHDLAEAITLSDEVLILTRRPARVAELHRIDLGDERDVSSIRETPEFQETYARLWAGLRHQIAASASTSIEKRKDAA